MVERSLFRASLTRIINDLQIHVRPHATPNILPNKAAGGFRVYGEKQVGNLVFIGGYTYNTARGGGISATLVQQVLTGGRGFSILRMSEARWDLA